MAHALFSGHRRWLTLGVIAIALACVRLGFWQLDRLAQRRAINAALAAHMAAPPTALIPALAADPTQEYRRVELRGVFDPAQEVVLRNRTLGGVPGVHVLTPLRFAGAGGEPLAVLVDRGWLPLDRADRAQRGAYAPPAGEVVLHGQIRRSQAGFGGPADPPLSAERPRLDAWFRVDPARIGEQAGYDLLPVFVEQLPAPGDPDLPRRDPLTSLGEGPHLGYALQWFGFALVALVGYGVFAYRYGAQRPQAPA